MTNIAKEDWQKAQKFEADWWGECINTFGEETKQIEYARNMGLKVEFADQCPYIDLKGKSILDIGGGATSLLLKCINGNKLVVIDPMPMPQWVLDRYKAANIIFAPLPAEQADQVRKLHELKFDEVWIYNVLQHVQDPKKIIENAKQLGKLIRIFEWANTPPHDGHPQTLVPEEMDKWLEGEGRVKRLDTKIWGGFSLAYYGIFPTKFYEGKIEDRSKEGGQPDNG